MSAPSSAKTRRRQSASQTPAGKPVPLWRTPVALAFGGAVLLWTSLPPVGLAPLAFFALIPWVLLLQLPTLQCDRPRWLGQRPYRMLYLAGFAFWLMALYWLTLPHWATNFGWLALSGYLGCYLPAFVLAGRLAVHRFRCPVIVAAPVVWTGLELARAHLVTGFTMASVSHSQYRWTELIQVADLAGPYLVSFVVMGVAACLAQVFPLAAFFAGTDSKPLKFNWRPLVPAAVFLALPLTYGSWRLNQIEAEGKASEPHDVVKVALIQENFPTEFKDDPGREDRVHYAYLSRSLEAKQADPDLDLIVWPETMFGKPYVQFTEEATPSPELLARYPDLTKQEFQAALGEAARRFDLRMEETVQALQTPVLVGAAAQEYHANGSVHRFNSAIFADEKAQVQMRYDKMHPVMFGEYVPMGNWFPWLYNLTPMSGGIDEGTSARCMSVGGVSFCPSICFEAILPHIVRRQINQLRAEGTEPDVLVSVTNDGWFWGSSELELHLICNVFRAVEHRKPMIVSANTGISAWIDAQGHVLAQGPRQAAAVIVASVHSHSTQSLYSRYGDWFAGLCLGLVALIYLAGGLLWWRDRKPQASAN